jgi:PAS domain S-box-containing protein
MPLSPANQTIKPILAERIAAALVLMLACAVVAGWWFKIETLVRLLPALTAMKFNTALGLACVSIAMLSTRRAVRWMLTVTVGMLGTATLVQYWTGWNLGIDTAFADAWPGVADEQRMAPQTAACFAMLSAAMILRNGERYWYRHLTLTLAWVVAGVGLLGLVGYVFSFQALYGMYGYVAMAAHTALAMAMLGGGILAGMRRDAHAESQASRDGQIVSRTAAMAVVAVAAITGLAGIVAVGQQMQSEAHRSLTEAMRAKQTVINLELMRRREDMDRLVTRPILLDGLQALGGDKQDSAALARLRTMITTLRDRPMRPDASGQVTSSPIEVSLDQGSAQDGGEDGQALLGIEVIALANGARIQAGSLTAAPELELPIDESTTLLWKGRSTMRMQSDAWWNGKRLGIVITEYRFALLDDAIAATYSLGASADLHVCGMSGARPICLPTRLPRNVNAGLQPDHPIARAMRDKVENAVVSSGDVSQVASYGVVPGTSLVLALVRDTNDLYGPLRTRLVIFGFLVALVMAVAVGVVRLRVLPLVAQIDAARQAAAANAAQLNAFMRTVPDGIISFDANGAIIDANPALARLFGYTLVELKGQPSTLLLPELASRDLRAYAHWSQSARELSLDAKHPLSANPETSPQVLGANLFAFTSDELTARHKDGFTFTVQLSLATVMLDDGEAFVGVVSDITERVRSRQRLNEAFDLLQTTVNSVSVGIAVFGANDKLRIWNGRFAEHMGVPPNRIVPGVTTVDVFRFASRFSMLNQDPKAISFPEVIAHAKQAGEHQAEYRRADGRVIEISIRPMPDRGFVLSLTDVSPLAEAEFKQRDQAVRLATTVDSINDAIITINEVGVIESWNRGAESLFGYTRQEVIGRSVNMFMPQPHAAAHNQYMRRYLQTGERHIIGNRRIVEAIHKSGEKIPVNLAVNEMVSNGQRLFVGVMSDMRSQLQMERIKSGFVSTVSHELRTPLTSIAGALGLLTGGAAGAIPVSAQRMLDIAKKNCDRLIRLINDILDIEKTESGQMEFKLGLQGLNALLSHAIEAMQGVASSSGVGIELQVADPAPTVMVDSDRFIQVMTNLLSNAVKFSPRGATVTVLISATTETVRVEVCDRGPGIAEEFRGRIFERFAQADHSDARSSGGTGLGLAISKSFIERMSGSIGFTSQLGKGTTFFVDLPNYTPIEDHVLGQSSVVRNLSVLICEDDRDAGKMIEGALAREGARTVLVRSLKDASNELLAYRYDLLITDVNLPDGSGLDLLRRLRAADVTRAVPVLVVSGSARTQHAAELLDTLSIAEWIRKPVVPAKILRAARAAVLNRGRNTCEILVLGDDAVMSNVLGTVLQGEVTLEAVRGAKEVKARLRDYRHVVLVVVAPISMDDEKALLALLREDVTTAVSLLVYGARGLSDALRARADVVIPHAKEAPDAMSQLITAIRQRVTPIKSNEAAGGLSVLASIG